MKWVLLFAALSLSLSMASAGAAPACNTAAPANGKCTQPCTEDKGKCVAPAKAPTCALTPAHDKTCSTGCVAAAGGFCKEAPAAPKTASTDHTVDPDVAWFKAQIDGTNKVDVDLKKKTMRLRSLRRQRQQQLEPLRHATVVADADADADVVEADVVEVEVAAQTGTSTSVEAALGQALLDAADGLQSWWGPSPKTVARLNAGGKTAWTEAQRRLWLFGEDVNDVDTARFATARVSASLSAQLSERLAVQAASRARAAERRRRSLRSESGQATSAKVLQTTCVGMVAAMRAYARANGNAYPTLAQLRPQVRLHVPTSTDIEINSLFDVVMHRASAQNAWNNVCDAVALQAGVDAQARTAAPVAVRTQDFAMGLEEEMNDIRMNPDNGNKNPIMRSGLVPAPRVSPYFKLAPDHTTAPTGYPHVNFGIVEAITGPMAISWANRAVHRAAVDRFMAQSPAPWFWQAEGAAQTFVQLCTAFNNALPNPPGGNYAFLLPAGNRADHATFAVTNYPNDQMTYNSIQVNFEASLCAVGASAGWLNLNVIAAQRNIWVAVRAAAAAFLNHGAGFGLGMPGVRLAAITGLSGQHLCELHGLFTTVFARSLFWGTIAGTVAKYGQGPAEPNNPNHPYGGTVKNFFAVMPKSITKDLVDLLEFPLSDIVHEFFTHYAANQVAVEGAMHALLLAELTNVASPYAGNVVAYVAPAPVALTAAAVPWLAVSGVYFRRSLESLMGAAALAALGHPNYNDAWVSHPPSGCYENPGALAQRQLVMVMEARFQDEPLQRAMTAQMAPLPHGAGVTQLVYNQNLVAGLAAAANRFVAGAAVPPAMPPP